MKLLASALCIAIGWAILENGAMHDLIKPYGPIGFVLIATGILIWLTSGRRRAQ
jgi:hypothetical protein